MNQLDMMTHLVDACRSLPECDMKRSRLRVAVKTAEHRIEVLRARKQRRDAARRARMEDDAELAAIAQANPGRFALAGRCPVCGYFMEHCRCPLVPGSLKEFAEQL